MKKCPNCGTEIEDASRFCKKCGYQFAETEMPAVKTKKHRKPLILICALAASAALCYFTSFHKTAMAWMRRIFPAPVDEYSTELFDRKRLQIITEGSFKKTEEGELGFVFDEKAFCEYLTADMDSDGKDEMLISNVDPHTGVYSLDIYKHNNEEAFLSDSFEILCGRPDYLSQHTVFYDNGVICISDSDNESQFISINGKLESNVLQRKTGSDVCSLTVKSIDGQYELIDFTSPQSFQQVQISSDEYQSLRKDLLRANILELQPLKWTPENLNYEIKSAVLLDSWISDHNITIDTLPGEYHVPVNSFGRRDDFWGRYYLDSTLNLTQEKNADGTKTLRFLMTVMDYPYTSVFLTYSVFDRYTGISFECNNEDEQDAPTHSCSVVFPLDDKTIDATVTYYDFDMIENEPSVVMEAVVPEDYEGTVFVIGVEFDPSSDDADEPDFSDGLHCVDEWLSTDGRYLFFTETNK